MAYKNLAQSIREAANEPAAIDGVRYTRSVVDKHLPDFKTFYDRYSTRVHTIIEKGVSKSAPNQLEKLKTAYRVLTGKEPETEEPKPPKK